MQSSLRLAKKKRGFPKIRGCCKLARDKGSTRESSRTVCHRLGSQAIVWRSAWSWAAERTTTRIEDRAYSLLGIFNVNMPLIYGEGLNAFRRFQDEIIKLQEDYSILAWGNRGTENMMIPYDYPCGALSRSPSAFKEYHADLNEYFEWNSEIVTSLNGDEIIPPMSMTSGDYGGCVYVDETDDIRDSQCTSIYIRRSDHELPLKWGLNESLFRVRTNMDSCIAWMEPIPVFTKNLHIEGAGRTNQSTVVLTGKESIFTRTHKPPDEFILTEHNGIEFIVPCMTESGVIFCIILLPRRYLIFYYSGPTHMDGGNTATPSIGRLNRAVQEIVSDRFKGDFVLELDPYTTDQFELTIKHTFNSTVKKLRGSRLRTDVMISCRKAPDNSRVS
ncbi:hypothetical protein CIB48_g38 [Xylaria polymorpha]|nr:hypothetical protein CIB48_g38 [Xylaria polymorpha]